MHPYNMIVPLKGYVLKLLILQGIFLLLFSCVPTKKIVYLQHQTDAAQLSPKDSVVREYSMKKEAYRLKPEDIVSIRVASLTESEFNFIKRYEENLGVIRKLNQYNQGEVDANQGGLGVTNRMGGGSEEGGGISPITLDRLNTGFSLDVRGELELPHVGVIQLSGLTLPEAETKVKEALEGYFETPMVRIQLLNFHYTMVGEVTTEGRYTSYNPELNIFDAILLSGNLTEFADRANVKIIRQENGEAKVIFLNLLDERSLSAENFYLKRDDLIIVPALEARTTTKYTVPNVTRTLGVVSAILSVTALIITLSRR